MKITNRHKGPLIIGGVILGPNQSADVPKWDAIKDTGIYPAWLKSGIITAGKAKAGDVAPDGDEPVGMIASHKGGGKYSVMDGDEEKASGLSKDDAASFNAMSDEEKAAYIETLE